MRCDDFPLLALCDFCVIFEAIWGGGVHSSLDSSF
jgi:hypothetical protein